MPKLNRIVRECTTEKAMLRTVQLMLRSTGRITVSEVEGRVYKVESITTPAKQEKFNKVEAGSDRSAGKQ